MTRAWKQQLLLWPEHSVTHSGFSRLFCLGEETGAGSWWLFEADLCFLFFFKKTDMFPSMLEESNKKQHLCSECSQLLYVGLPGWNVLSCLFVFSPLCFFLKSALQKSRGVVSLCLTHTQVHTHIASTTEISSVPTINGLESLLTQILLGQDRCR